MPVADVNTEGAQAMRICRHDYPLLPPVGRFTKQIDVLGVFQLVRDDCEFVGRERLAQHSRPTCHSRVPPPRQRPRKASLNIRMAGGKRRHAFRLSPESHRHCNLGLLPSMGRCSRLLFPTLLATPVSGDFPNW